ncbi:PREDICTED: uncharacterized protein LOC101313768 [Fragaria vesca subsp. vesca]
MWTISDFPAYGMLSSHVTKGYKACPVYGDGIDSSWHAGKVCYLGSHRSLDEDHEWRQDAETFDGSQEFLPKPQEWSGDQILEYLNGIDFKQKSSDPKVVTNNPKQLDESGNWTGKSIFFELPYWSKLRIRHNLDVMHIEKNVCDSVLRTILNIKEKNKDTIKARLDLEQNISRCVKVAENKILGLKSHDCHVLLQCLLPVVIRPYLHSDVVEVLVVLSRFFQKLCTRELKKSYVLRMKEEIVYILCKIERIFPPAFFDIMIHLMIHLPEQVLLSGPIHDTWMFPIERQLGGYKKYVRNRSNPEGSIAETYLAHECVTYCNSYIFNKDDIVANDATNAPQFNLSVVLELVKPFRNIPYTERLTDAELIEAHWYVLQNCAEVNEYREYHLDHITDAYPNKHEETHKKEFPNYFLEWKLRQAQGLFFGNSVYSVRFDEEFSEKKFKSSSPFGIKYMFHLEGVVDCPEWIVPFHVFKSLAEEYDLELVFVKNFHEFVHQYLELPKYVDLMRKIGALGDQSTLSQDEWEVAHLYSSFVLRKRGAQPA